MRLGGVWIGLFLGSLSVLHGWSLPEHAYLTWKTPEVWQNLDPEFYQVLMDLWSDDYGRRYQAVLTWHAYLWGAMLPDLLDEASQRGAARIVQKLYEIQNVCVKVDAPLEIKNNTYNTLVGNGGRFQLIDFKDFPPNENLAKLWEMVQYARSRTDWHPKQKALIYGAYAHVVQDLFVHMVFQPAHAGYGYNLLGFVPEDGNQFLEIYETFFETMSPSFIPRSEIETPLKMMWLRLITNGSITPGEYGPMELYTHGGRHWMSLYQDTILPWVQGFVDAFHAVGYGATGMTARRLSAILEGSAILTFLVMGYEKTGATGVTKVGWAMLHPEWSFWDLKNYESNRIAPYVETNELCYVTLGSLVSIFIPQPFSGIATSLLMVAFLVDNLLHDEVIEFGLRRMTLPIQPFALNFDCIDDLSGGWMSYLSDTTRFDQLASCAVDLNYEQYQRYRRHIAAWQQYSTVLPPHLRSSYQEQHRLLLMPGWKALYVDRFRAGPSSALYFDYGGRRWFFSRKAGVLGGM